MKFYFLSEILFFKQGGNQLQTIWSLNKSKIILLFRICFCFVIIMKFPLTYQQESPRKFQASESLLLNCSTDVVTTIHCHILATHKLYPMPDIKHNTSGKIRRTTQQNKNCVLWRKIVLAINYLSTIYIKLN